MKKTLPLLLLTALAASVALADDKPKADARRILSISRRARRSRKRARSPKPTTSRCREYRSSAIRIYAQVAE